MCALPADIDIEEQIKKLKEGDVTAEFECYECGSGFGKRKPEQCPKCGSYAIEEIKILQVND